MANSYKIHTANGSTTDFGFSDIDGWISSGFLKVYVNDVLQTTGYTLQDLTTASPFVRFATAPANLAIVRIQRETPSTVSGFQGNVVNFNDASVLTEADLDNMAKGLLHISQEAEDTGSGALPLNLAQTHWDAGAKKLTNLADGTDAQDAVTMAQLTTATLYGGATTTPQVWAWTGTGSDAYAFSPAPLNLTEEMFLVERGGVIQHPDTYTITETALVFDTPVGSGVAINARNFGVARNINESVTTAMLVNDSVTAAKLADSVSVDGDRAVTTNHIRDTAITTAKIANDAVTYAKIQNVSDTDKVLGRSSAGGGDIEEIICTLAGRSLLDDASSSEQRNTLGLGTLAVKSTIINTDIDATAAIALSKLTTINSARILGRITANAGAIESLDAGGARSVLGIPSPAEQADRTKIGALAIATWVAATMGNNAPAPGTTITGTPNKVVINATTNDWVINTSGTHVGGTWTVCSANVTDASRYSILLVRTA
jgi:hypothetical protein